VEEIIIFDTTLREGEQSPGASLNVKEKVEIARALAALNVDVIEAGFPRSSPGDFEAVEAVAEEIRGRTVAALARAVPKDIEEAAEALKRAEKARIHVFLATSAIHRKYKLKKAREEIVRLAVENVRFAKSLVEDVEFSPEDASRTEPEFLAEVVQAVVEAGATTVNIPDTVGYAMPDEFAALIRYLKKNVRGIEKVIISVHCHDDLGMAVANSLAGVKAGARQIECAVNGLGERAGSAPTEEVAMAIATRRDFFGFKTRVNTKKIYPTSRLVSTLTGLYVQRNKAIVGENAFAHEAGIHQDGVLKERRTYEIMRPEDVGLVRSRLVLGKHSGRHALKERIRQLGHELSDESLERLFEQFKILADKKKEVYDEDLEALIGEEIGVTPETYEIENIQSTSGTNMVPMASVRLKGPGGEILQDAACGDGPVDALYRAIDRLTGVSGRLTDYSVRAITGGKEAMGEVSVEVDFEGIVTRGRATSTDIIEASARAYINAINKLLARRKSKAANRQPNI